MNLIAEDASPSREEVYQALVRSLRRRKGFGIVFVQCSPAEATRLIQEIQTDLPRKQFANLNIDAPIDNLYDLVTELPNRENLNILFIQGLEKSLEPYIKPGYGGDGDYYNVDTVPTILSHLNQRRELFRDHFHNICFVFFLPPFAIKYIIRRSPDLFDWSAGVFELLSEMDFLLIQAQDLDYIWLNEGNNLFDLGKYEEAIASYDQILKIKPDKYEAWYNRGNALDDLGKYEEAIASYDKALEIKPDFHEAWNNRGNALNGLGRYEEATASCDKALEIKPDFHEAWHSRGIALKNLGRYEEAIASYDKALEAMNTVQIPLRKAGNKLAFNFNIAFQELMKKNPEITPDSIQGIQKKGEDILVTIEVPEGIAKSKIERDFLESYKLQAALHAQDIKEKSYKLQAALLEAKTLHAQNIKEITLALIKNPPLANPIINLGTISGTVAHTINELPKSPQPNQPGIKELLSQLHQAIETDPKLTSEKKAKVLKQLQALAEAGKNPTAEATKETADNALTMLKGLMTGLPLAAAAVKACNELLPAIAQLFGLG